MKIILSIGACCLFAFGAIGQNSPEMLEKATVLYKGDRKPHGEVAIICKGNDYCRENYAAIRFNSLVRAFISVPQKNKKKAKLKTIGNKGCVEILPGETDICVSVDVAPTGNSKLVWHKCVSFKSEAGHDYSVEACAGISPGVWIVDRTANKIVVAEGNLPESFLSANPTISR